MLRYFYLQIREVKAHTFIFGITFFAILSSLKSCNLSNENHSTFNQPVVSFKLSGSETQRPFIWDKYYSSCFVEDTSLSYNSEDSIVQLSVPLNIFEKPDVTISCAIHFKENDKKIYMADTSLKSSNLRSGANVFLAMSYQLDSIIYQLLVDTVLVNERARLFFNFTTSSDMLCTEYNVEMEGLENANFEFKNMTQITGGTRDTCKSELLAPKAFSYGLHNFNFQLKNKYGHMQTIKADYVALQPSSLKIPSSNETFISGCEFVTVPSKVEFIGMVFPDSNNLGESNSWNLGGNSRPGMKITGNEFRWTPTLQDIGDTVSIRLWAEDSQFVQDMEMCFIVSNGNKPPTVYGPDSSVFNVDIISTETITWEDKDNSSIDFSLGNNPGFFNITNAGLLTANPECRDVGIDTLSIYGHDGEGGRDTLSLPFRVNKSTTFMAVNENGSVKSYSSNSKSIVRKSNIKFVGMVFTRSEKLDSTLGAWNIYGNSRGDMKMSGKEFSWTPTLQDDGDTVSVIIRADSNQCVQDLNMNFIVFNGNMPPVLKGPDSKVCTAGVSDTIAIEWTDHDNDSINFTLGNNPGLFNINNTGILTANPECRDVGKDTLSIYGHDGEGGRDTLSLPFRVNKSTTFMAVNENGSVKNYPSNFKSIMLKSKTKFVGTVFTRSEKLDSTLGAWNIYGNSRGDMKMSGKEFSWTPTLQDDGDTVSVIIRADSSQCVQDMNMNFIVFNGNIPPVINGPDSSRFIANISNTLPIQWTDGDNDAINFTLGNNPGYFDINNTGILTANPGCLDVGSDTISIYAHDSEGGGDTLNLRFRVEKSITHMAVIKNQSELTYPSNSKDLTLSSKTSFSGRVITELDGLDTSFSNNVSWNIHGNSRGDMNISGNVFSWSPTFQDVGDTVSVTIRADSSQCVQDMNMNFIITNGNISPNINGPDSSRFTAGISDTLPIQWTDDDNDAINFTLGNNPGYFDINNTGILTITPRCQDVGSDTISIYGHDSEGGGDTLNLRFSVEKSATYMTVNDIYKSEIIYQSNSKPIELKSKTKFVGTIFTSSKKLDTTLGNWNIYGDPIGDMKVSAKEFSWTPTYQDVGDTVSVSIRADSSQCVQDMNMDFIITNGNIPPVINGPDSSRFIAGTSNTLSIQWTDDDDSIHFSLGNNPGYLSISNYGKLTGIPKCTNLGREEIMIYGNDNEGEIDSLNMYLEVYGKLYLRDSSDMDTMRYYTGHHFEKTWDNYFTLIPVWEYCSNSPRIDSLWVFELLEENIDVFDPTYVFFDKMTGKISMYSKICTNKKELLLNLYLYRLKEFVKISVTFGCDN